MHFAELFQLDAQAMSQRAFGTELVQEVFRLVKRLMRNVFALEQAAKAALNLGFGKQSEISWPHQSPGEARGPLFR
jgi:hypothetical protein